MLKACDAKDQPITKEIHASAVQVQGEVGQQDIVTVDCAGKTIKKEHGETESLDIPLMIEPPQGLNKPVDHIDYKNYRTCFTITNQAATSDRAFDQKPPADLDAPLAAMVNLNVLHADGRLQLRLDDSESSIDFSGVPVREGANLLEIVYYDAQGAVLAKKQVEADVHIVRKELGGTKQITQCDQKSK